MTRQQFFIIITLIMIYSTITISATYAQSSYPIPSPKEQLDSGIMLHDVICRNDLLLVDQGFDKIACVSEKTARESGWIVLTDTQSTKIKYHILNENIHTNVYDGKLTINSIPHQPYVAYMTPIISLEIPKYIKFNETVIINYTVDWINDDGTPLYLAPDGNAGNPRPYRIDENGAIRYIGYDGNDVSFTMYMFLNSEFTMLTDSFKPESIEAGTYIQYMRILYAGEPIFFNNETIHGSIKFQLTRPLVFDKTHFHVWFKNATGVLASLQLFSTEYGVLFEKFVPRAKQSVSSYTTYSELYFNDTTQKWSRGDQEFETLPNGLPDYIPKPRPIQQPAPPSNEIRRPFSLPQEDWEHFAEFLRSVEKNEGMQINKGWLMAENSAEDFVDDFLNAYPEFLTKNIIFSNFFIYPMPSAVDLYDFIVYGHYNTQ